MSTLLFIVGMLSALRVPGPLSPRAASYWIEARLDAPSRELRGREVLTWRNDASGPATELVFHLYMNAFKNDASLFFAEREQRSRPAIEDRRWGFAQVESVRLRRAGEPARALRLEVPPLGDQTLGRVSLDRPIAPGETVEIELAFVTRLPAITLRSGVDQGFYAVTQWFPKIGVFECTPTCAFRADAYHANSEFYADFGTYDVTLDLPAELVVGATGVRTGEERSGDRQRLRFRAEDVHDFAFIADARFVVHERMVTDDPALPPVRVLLLGEERLRGNVERHLRAATAGLSELGRRLGAYPYSQLTIVQTPPGAEEAGAMEYPTLFLTEDRYAPPWLLLPELVTAHELAHQWFQGMLASDEVNEAWLDEGLTELATGWVLERLAPPLATFYETRGHRMSYVDAERERLAGNTFDMVAQPSFAFADGESYAEHTYRKTALLLSTLRARMGEEPFAQAMRAYADRFRFRHPRGQDLIAAFASAPAPLRRLLSEGLTRPGHLDYAIAEVDARALHAMEGLLDADGGVTETRDAPRTGRYRNRVLVEERGEHRLPVTVRLRFADGSSVDRVVFDDEGPLRWRRIELEGPQPVVEAQLHPSGDTPLDARRWNDGRSAEPAAWPRRRLTTSLELLLALSLSWVTR